MTDAEIMKALELCSSEDDGSVVCPNCPAREECYGEIGMHALEKAALDLIKRQQKKIDELTDREAVFSFDRINRNIAELNLILEGYNVAELKKRFRECFEEQMELGIEDCINWADWLDSIASEMWKEVKLNDR